MIASLTADDHSATLSTVNIPFLGREHGRESQECQRWKEEGGESRRDGEGEGWAEEAGDGEQDCEEAASEAGKGAYTAECSAGRGASRFNDTNCT